MTHSFRDFVTLAWSAPTNETQYCLRSNPPAVTEYLGELRNAAPRLAWVDDHMNHEARLFAQSWPAGTLLIRTKRDVGLKDEIVDKLCEFAPGGTDAAVS